MLVTTMTGASFLTTIMYTFREFDTGQFYTMLPHLNVSLISSVT